MMYEDLKHQARAFLDAEQKGITFHEWAESKDFSVGDRLIILSYVEVYRNES